MTIHDSANQRISLVEIKDVPQNDAKKAVNQYYSTKYNKCLKPQHKIPKNNSFRKLRSKINKKSLPKQMKRKSTTKHSKSKSKTKSKSKSNRKKACVIRTNSYTTSRKHYKKFQ